MFSKNSITVKNIIFLIMVILLIKFISKITPIAMLFFAGYVLACSLNPLVDKFETKMSRPLATSIVLGGVTIIIFAVLIPLLVIATKQIETLLMSAPQQFELIKAFILKQKILGQSIVSMIDIPSIIQPMTNFTRQIVEESISLTLNFASALVYLFAMCVITYYFIVDRDTIRKGFMLLFPDHIKQKADKITSTISQKIGNYIIAQLTAITGVENNFVRPYVFGKFLDLHPLIIFFAIFVTAKFLGVIGVVFAPALAATIAVLVDELYIKPINRKPN